MNPLVLPGEEASPAKISNYHGQKILIGLFIQRAQNKVSSVREMNKCFNSDRSTDRHLRKQTYDYQGGKEVGRDKLGDWD